MGSELTPNYSVGIEDECVKEEDALFQLPSQDQCTGELCLMCALTYSSNPIETYDKGMANTCIYLDRYGLIEFEGEEYKDGYYLPCLYRNGNCNSTDDI